MTVCAMKHKIRLDGIDAPELGQPFGRASKQHLAELLANREAVAECSVAAFEADHPLLDKEAVQQDATDLFVAEHGDDE